MTLELRPVGRDEADAFVGLVELAFGATADEDDLARHRSHFEPEFALGVFDQSRIVATASAELLEMTLPAAPGVALSTVSVPGITAVGVAPTHRRQGLLTRLMDHQLAELREQGYPLAALLASESIIYGRFGYGLAQHVQSLVIERIRAGFRPDAATLAAEGRVRIVEADEAAKLLPLLHDRARRLRPGELNRGARWWEWHFKDREKDRDGGGARLYAVHESAAGEADGWVSYRFHRHWPDSGLPEGRVDVDDMVTTNRAGRAALWRLVLDLDLVDEVRAGFQPVDEPLKWMLADPRRLRTREVSDHLWVRILDVASALEGRGYGGTERLVVEVTSADPSASGRFVLESGPASGSCRPAKRGEKGQLVLGLADLGAIYLGGVAPSILAAAGRVSELRPGALAVADRVFASPVAPFCTLGF